MFADALVVGGGIQGLVALRALTEAGYRTVLVTDGKLGSGQTLHSHGLRDSGTGLVTGETQAELVDHVLPELSRLGVAVRSDARPTSLCRRRWSSSSRRCGPPGASLRSRSTTSTSPASTSRGRSTE